MADRQDFLDESELEMIHMRWVSTTPGPWRSFVEGRDHTSGSSFIMTGSSDARGPDIELSGATVADQDFIASAHEDIPKLLAEIARLKSLIKG
jgi:hypothetical protein